MGISPITNLAPLGRAIEPDIEPLPMARVENSARTGDETYSPSGGKASRGQEDDGQEDEFEDLASPEEQQPTTDLAGAGPARQVSFFA